MRTFIDNHVLLKISDTRIKKDYEAMKRRQINLLGGLLLLLRMINIVYRAFGYHSYGKCVVQYYYLLSGIGVHIITLLASLKWQRISFLMSFIVLISFSNMQFCGNDSFNNSDDVAILLDILIFDFGASLFLSMSWILTTLGSLILKGTIFYVVVMKNQREYIDIIYPLNLAFSIQIILVYLMEKHQKTLHVREQTSLQTQNNYCSIIDKLASMLVVYSTQDGKIRFTSEKLLKFLDKNQLSGVFQDPLTILEMPLFQINRQTLQKSQNKEQEEIRNQLDDKIYSLLQIIEKSFHEQYIFTIVRSSSQYVDNQGLQQDLQPDITDAKWNQDIENENAFDQLFLIEKVEIQYDCQPSNMIIIRNIKYTEQMKMNSEIFDQQSINYLRLNQIEPRLMIYTDKMDIKKNE